MSTTSSSSSSNDDPMQVSSERQETASSSTSSQQTSMQMSSSSSAPAMNGTADNNIDIPTQSPKETSEGSAGSEVPSSSSASASGSGFQVASSGTTTTTTAPANNSTSTSVSNPPFRMKILHTNANSKQSKSKLRKRKSRKRKLGQAGLSPLTSSSSSSSASSSSDDDDDDTDGETTASNESSQASVTKQLSSAHVSGNSAFTATSKARAADAETNTGGGILSQRLSSYNASSVSGGGKRADQQQLPQQQQQILEQPEGWRVKLYRLNADGSWDDCGTGRIVCLYRPTNTGNNNAAENTNAQDCTNDSDQLDQSTPDANMDEEVQQETTDASASAEGGESSDPDRADSAKNSNAEGSDQWLYQETGDATLCVHAEVTPKSRTPRVLLRTRILLRDAYQRQGDNIITWCEPYYSTASGGENGANRNQASDTDGKGGTIGTINNEDETTQESSGGENGSRGSTGGVDLALSFQDNAGCLDIWRQITSVQAKANELLQRRQLRKSSDKHGGGSSVEDLAAQVAAQHHADLQRQQHEMWSSATASSQNQHHVVSDDHMMMRNGAGMAGSNDMVGGGSEMYNTLLEAAHSLPNPPTLQNLEEIADTIAALQHVQQRENLAMWIAKDECAYLKALLALFPEAEDRGDYGKLATLAACVKTILLLNDPSILELIVSVASIFEEICSCLEYDPDLREKANHRWFLRERAKFRTVVPMEDPDLVSAIHRSFRVSYLRDTLLRPTMDESSLSTLSSLQTFTHADVVKGVTMAGQDPDGSLFDSYLIKVIDTLCIELHALSTSEWAELEATPSGSQRMVDEPRTDPSIVVGKHPLGTTTWKQYLAPQDGSLSSRRMRRRGCLSFLKELFNMVRLSLQQSDKDDFFSVICTLDIDLNEVGHEIADNASQTSQMVEVGSVASTVKSDRLDEKTDVPHNPVIETATLPPSTNLLSMLGCILGDPSTDVTEKGSVLEIIGGVVMHDAGLIRRHCLEFQNARKKMLETKSDGDYKGVSPRPKPNEKKQVVFWCPTNDLLASLLFLLAIETDAGVLLQVSEIMRIILDTDLMGEHGPLSAFADEAEGLPPGSSGQLQPHDQHNHPSGMAATTTDQKQFLSLFYEHYVEWLVAPFQFTLLYPIRRVPDHFLLDTSESPLMKRLLANFESGISPGDPWLLTVPPCAIRSSFAVELLSFCVRAHLYRMKFFLLKSSVLGNVLKLLTPEPHGRGISGDRCLKLASLRFLRAILSVNDEFYHRHIIQNDLFAPVFEALRANPVGDNLVSSAIVEMCDYIHSENVKPLIEYIVTKHLSASHAENTVPSLEDVSSPYVSTLTVLRKAYEANLNATKTPQSPVSGDNSSASTPVSPGGSRYFRDGLARQHGAARQLSGKALEDQRKFREADQEESYFDSDDGGPSAGRAVPPAVDEVDAQQAVESELHRTPRMFSLAQAPLLNNLEDNSSSHKNRENIENGPGDGQPPSTMDVDVDVDDDGDVGSSDQSSARSGEAMST